MMKPGTALAIITLTSVGTAVANQIRFEQVTDKSQLAEGLRYVILGQWYDQANSNEKCYAVMGSYSRQSTVSGHPGIDVQLNPDGTVSIDESQLSSSPATEYVYNKVLSLNLRKSESRSDTYDFVADGCQLYGFGNNASYYNPDYIYNACLPLATSSIQAYGWSIMFSPDDYLHAMIYYGESAYKGEDPSLYPTQPEETTLLMCSYYRTVYYSGSYYYSFIHFDNTEDGVYFYGGNSQSFSWDEANRLHFNTHTMLFREVCDHSAVMPYSEDATCWETGISPIYYCSKCETYFTDQACTQPTTLEECRTDALGHTYDADGNCVRCASTNREIKWVDYSFAFAEGSPDVAQNIIVAQKDGVTYAMTNQRSANGYRAVPVEMDDQRRIFAAEGNLVVLSSNTEGWGNHIGYHNQKLYIDTKTHVIRFRKQHEENLLEAYYNYSDGFNEPSSVRFSCDYSIALVGNSTDGFRFEAIPNDELNQMPYEEWIHIFQRSCDHAMLTHVEAHAPTCEKFGNIEFWYCNNCNCHYSSYSADKEIIIDERHTTTIAPLRHHYEPGSSLCAHCGQEAPVYRRVEHQSQLTEAGHYLVGAEVDGHTYILGSYNETYDRENEQPIIQEYDPNVPGSVPTFVGRKVPVMLEVVPESDGVIRANYDYLERLRPKRNHFNEPKEYYDENWNPYQVDAWWDIWNLVTDDFSAWASDFESFNCKYLTYDDARRQVFEPQPYDQEEYGYMWQSVFGENYWLMIDVFENRDLPEYWANRYRGSEYEQEEGYFYGNVPADRQQPYNVFMQQPNSWGSDPSYDFAYYHGKYIPSWVDPAEEETEQPGFHLESAGQIVSQFEGGMAFGNYPIVLYYCADEPSNTDGFDLNGDTVFDEEDITTLATQIITTMEWNPELIIHCDVTNDGEVNVADIITLLNALNKQVPDGDEDIEGVAPNEPQAPVRGEE